MYLEVSGGFPPFPYPLFAMLWLLPFAVVFVATPLIRATRSGEGVLARPVVLVARVGFLVLAVLLWVIIVNDQMPCFLGVPNCD
jgi:hypothetical protein